MAGDYLYLTLGEDGLRVLDVSDPEDPVLVGNNLNFNGARQVVVTNGKVFVRTDDGMAILHTYQPLRLEHLSREENGALSLNILGPPGVPGRIQRSSGLDRWEDWLPVDFQETPTELIDPDAATNSAGFYRLVTP